MSWLDFRLGIRMLVRYPILTVVGGLAMAFAIAAGAGTFEVITRVTAPTLPLPDGDRIVGFNYWDPAESTRKPTTGYDFAMWRDGLRTVQDLGGYRMAERNLSVGPDAGAPVQIAEISAAAFRVARVPPLLGRTLVEADEDPRAAPVVLIGHHVWQTRFGADPAVVGRVVRLGDADATVIGVMPEGFGFPISHDFWTALRWDTLPREPGRGALNLFGRLAPGVTLREAQAEVAIVVARAAAAFPEHYGKLRPQVLPYAKSVMFIPPDFLMRAGIQSINVLAALFLIVVCGNVALLMFARAATREREILVRGALGASRSRIVMQLFAEALVLGALAAALGLTTTNVGLKWLLNAMSSDSDRLPFWVQSGLSPTTLIYTVLLTLLAAAVTGVIPALKVTGRRLESRLREASGGAGGLRMGGFWTVLIIVQIALTVVFTAVAYVAQRQAAQIASTKAAFPVDDYLAVRLEMESRTDYAAAVRSLQRRLAADPAVAGVTLAERLPLMPQTNDRIEVESAGPAREHRAATSGVDLDFFRVFQTPLSSGHGFTAADMDNRANIVVVNQLFADRVFAGRNAIGQRIRYKPARGRTVAEPGPWLEIVGVVPDLVLDIHAPLNLDNPAKQVVYRPLDPASYPLYLGVHLRGNAGSFAPALRRMAADVSPALRLNEIERLDLATSGDARIWRAMANVITTISAITLFLSLAGIYAIMSFAVTRRTREIAIRVALGAQARGVVAEILRKPLSHVATGALLGCIPVGGAVALAMRGSNADIGTITARAGLLLAYAILMVTVCALACLGPTLRALRVEPTEALREEQ